MKNITLSNWILFAIILLLAYLILPQGLTFNISWDLFGQYIYLPLVFDRHDLILHDLSYVDAINQAHNISPTLYHFVPTQDGLYFTKYTAGVAILQIPFYLIAEVWAMIGGYPTDGFSFPYQFMMNAGAFFYVALGLYFVKKLLTHFFSDKWTSALLILLVFGTNLFAMQWRASSTSHIPAFCFVALLMLRVIRYNENPSLKNASFVGIVLGILTLIRPPDVIFGLLILLWGVTNYTSFKLKLRYFFIEHRKDTATILISFFLILSPQLIYWYTSTGSLIINSYANNTGEGFDFTHPHTIEFLFSFRKGWFIYTPLMILAIFGVWKMWKNNPNYLALTITAILFLYVVSSWTCWWYASSYGQRAAVDMYPITIIFVGFFIQSFWKSYQKYLVSTLIGLMLVLNGIQIYQYSNHIISDWRMTKEYYFSTFLQFTAPTAEQQKLLSIDREFKWMKGFNNESEYKKIHVENETFESEQIISSENVYAKEQFLPVSEFVKKSHVWLRLTWEYDDENNLPGTVFYVSTIYGKTAYTWVGYEVGQKFVNLDSTNNTIQFDYLSPHIRSNSDRFCIGAYKPWGDPIKLISRKIEIFEPILDYE